MFQAAHRSSSGALTCICSLWFIYTCGDQPLSSLSGKIPTQTWQRPVITCVCKPEAANSLELLMMSGVPLETRWAFNKRWNNKFYCKFASCWLFLLIHTTMHGSMNIKSARIDLCMFIPDFIKICTLLCTVFTYLGLNLLVRTHLVSCPTRSLTKD